MLYYRDGEDWSRLRKALAPKMLRPKDIRENLDNFIAVTKDAIEHMVAIRGADDVIPDLEGEILKWATECKPNKVLFPLPNYRKTITNKQTSRQTDRRTNRQTRTNKMRN